MKQAIGHLISIEPADAGSTGIVDVRGARIRVPLLLTPDAVLGDTVLIDAGVAVAVLEQRPEGPHHERRT